MHCDAIKHQNHGKKIIMYTVNAKTVKQAIRRFGTVIFEDSRITVQSNYDSSHNVSMKAGSGEPQILCKFSLEQAVKMFNDSDTLTIKHGAVENGLGVMATVEMVDRPERRIIQVDNTACTARIEFKEAKTLVNNLLSHSGNNDVRYYLNGALFQLPAGAALMNIVATDGHRLYKTHLSGCNTGPTVDDSQDINFIVPRLALEQIKRSMVSNKSEWVSIALCQSGLIGKALFQDGSTVSFKAVDGRFPDYARVIPADKEREARVTMDKKALVNTLSNVVKAMKGDKYPAIAITVNGAVKFEKADKIEVSIPYIERENGEEEYQIGLNAQYLLDSVKAWTTDRITLRFAESKTHWNSVLLNMGPDTAVIMPVRL